MTCYAISWHARPQVKAGTWFEDDPTPLHGVDSNMQRKILPWDKLELVREHQIRFGAIRYVHQLDY